MAGEALGILEITELRLGLPGVENNVKKKRQFLEITPRPAGLGDENSCSDEAAWGAKTAIVGWPPVCSYRQKHRGSGGDGKGHETKKYVKVSMDGAAYLRKIDLNTYKRYSDLSIGLKKLFGCFRIGPLIGKDSEYSEYNTIYEDKDGDWMLAGDVPWEMFTESCRRLRIMKSSEANGLKLQLRGLQTSHGN